MKRFLMFLVIAIAVVSLGLTIYYFSTDNEVIYIKSSYLVVEKGDYIQDNSLLEFKNKSEYTTLKYSLQSNERKDGLNVLEHNEEGYYLAVNGGKSQIVVKTNNRSYSKLVIDVLVCDGSEDYPYIISTEEDLKKIGHDDEGVYTLSKSYKLGNNIELTEEWTPLGSYSGVFDGNYFYISDMKITGGTNTDVGFVSILEDKGKIKNLFLVDVDIDVSAKHVGAYAGTNQGIIQTSEATGYIKNTINGQAYTAGIAGRNNYNSARPKIDRCGFEGTIETTGSSTIAYAGGVVGHNESGMISETYFRGQVINNETNFGGVVGYNQGVTATADIYDSYFYLQESTGYQKTRMAGVVYDNICQASTDNMITGCYFGGELENDTINGFANKMDGAEESVSQANGYLTKSEFVTKNKFVTTKAKDVDGKNRLWNFSSVWEIPAKSQYPILNVYSSAGSSYIIDVSDIETGESVSSAETLYNILYNNKTDKVYQITKDIDLSPETLGWTWGDESHPLPERFDGTLINGTTKEVINEGTPEEATITRPCKLKGLTIYNKDVNSNVGIVKVLGEQAIFSGLVFETVTIRGEKAVNVGVLAGNSEGANIYNIRINSVKVHLKGNAFGGLVGFAKHYDGHGISDVQVRTVTTQDAYFVYAGGLVGINLTTITSTAGDEYEEGTGAVAKSAYNYAYNVSLVANFSGGIAGANGGNIQYTSAQHIAFNRQQDEETLQNLYNGTYDIFVGGAVGINDITYAGTKMRGTVTDVYTNINIVAQTGAEYQMYLGGIAGYNSSDISRAYVTDSSIVVKGSQHAFVGGITGYNAGKISNSVVDEKCSISTPIVASIGATNASDKYLMNTDICTIVGGIVGYDAVTSNAYSVYQCASYAKELKGYYAGGVIGLAFGRVEKSFCGETTKANGGVKVTGYIAGGIAAIVGGGHVKNCYAVATLATTEFSGKYTDILSVVKMDVSAAAGIAVFALNKGTEVSGCYAAVSFTGPGVTFGGLADLTGYVRGTVKNCVYIKAGSKASYGTQISLNKMKGSDNFKTFFSKIGADTLTWETTTNELPTLYGVNVRFPNSQLPVFH